MIRNTSFWQYWMFAMLSSAETAVFLESYGLSLCNGTSLKCATCETKDGKNLLTSVTDVLAYRGQIPVAARSKARICGHLFVGIAVSNTAEGMSVCLFVVSVVCCVLSGKGLCGGPILYPEGSYCIWCVWAWSWSFDNDETLAHWGLLLLGGVKSRTLVKIISTGATNLHVSSRAVLEICVQF
jgi:hypothetical protein